MKIAFWSNIHGQTGATSNMLASAIVNVVLHKRKTAVLQSHFSLNNLELPLLGRDMRTDDFSDIGTDALIRDIKSRPLTQEIIHNNSISLMDRHLALFPGTEKKSREVYEKDIQDIFQAIINEVAGCYDDVFIDVASGYNEFSNSLIADADLTIVNLSQNIYVLQRYFNTPHLNKNILYLIGNYDRNSRYNLKNLERMFPPLKKKTGVIPYNIEFVDAQNEGMVIPFFLKNIDCARESSNYEFIQSARRMAGLIERAR